LGSIDCEEGRHTLAHAKYCDAMAIFADLGHRRGLARAVEGFACLAGARGHAPRALRLAFPAARLPRLIGTPLPQAEQSRLEQKLLPAWESLTGPQGNNAWAEGSTMDLQKAVQYCLEEESVNSGR